MKKRATKILLGSHDAALVFRSNGEFEFLLPDRHGNDVVPDHIMHASRAALLIKCPEAIEVMRKFMDKIRAQH